MLAAFGICLTIVQFIYNWQRNQKKDNTEELALIRSDRNADRQRIEAMQIEIGQLKISADYSWKMIEMYAGKILHQDDTPDIDRYIDKNEAEGLSRKEAEEFAIILDGIITSSGDDDGRKAVATMMLAAIVRRYRLTPRVEA